MALTCIEACDPDPSLGKDFEGGTSEDASPPGDAAQEAATVAQDAGSAGVSPPGADPRRCPRTKLQGSLPLEYEGDTRGIADLFQSMRLEWKDAPDDTLLFTAPAAGKYRFTLDEAAKSRGCDASIHDSQGALYTTQLCPKSALPTTIDGYFRPEAELAAGQELLVLVSCAQWSKVQAGPYRLRIEKL